jgi:hypothetical protein
MAVGLITDCMIIPGAIDASVGRWHCELIGLPNIFDTLATTMPLWRLRPAIADHAAICTNLTTQQTHSRRKVIIVVSMREMCYIRFVCLCSALPQLYFAYPLRPRLESLRLSAHIHPSH